MNIKTNIIVIVCLGVFVSAAAAAQQFTAGHGDLGLGEGSELELHLHLGGEGEAAVVDGNPVFDTEYEPDEITVVVPAATEQVRQAGPAWDKLGISAGEKFWIIPESESDAESWDAPFLGVGAEEVDMDSFDDNELTLTLKGVNGPGQFSLYNLELGTPEYLMSSFDGGITSDDRFILDLDDEDHAHFNFAFTQPGTYEIDFEVSAFVSGVKETDEATFTFEVIPEPLSLSLLGLGGLLVHRRRR